MTSESDLLSREELARIERHLANGLNPFLMDQAVPVDASSVTEDGIRKLMKHIRAQEAALGAAAEWLFVASNPKS